MRVFFSSYGARGGDPPKTPDNSSLSPSKGQKPNLPEKAKRIGPRQGSLGRKGGGHALVYAPDETVTAKATACAHCRAALTNDDQVLRGRYDKIDLPVSCPVVTRVARNVGHCPCCGGVTLAPMQDGMEEGSPFGINILALAIYLCCTHVLFQRGKPCFDNGCAAILARLCRSRIVCSDETSVRIDGKTRWNRVFALYGAQQGHTDRWQLCLAHQLRDRKYAIEAGDAIFAPPLKMLLPRAVVLARRTYLLRPDREMTAIMGRAPANRRGKILHNRYGMVRNGLFTFLEHPDVSPNNVGR